MHALRAGRGVRCAYVFVRVAHLSWKMCPLYFFGTNTFQLKVFTRGSLALSVRKTERFKFMCGGGVPSSHPPTPHPPTSLPCRLRVCFLSDGQIHDTARHGCGLAGGHNTLISATRKKKRRKAPRCSPRLSDVILSTLKRCVHINETSCIGRASRTSELAGPARAR